jgi:hypothetical protein
MNLRPELIIAREQVQRRQLEIIRERNGLLPDVRLEAGYNIHGFGTRLDGESTFANGLTDNALRSLADTHFTDYNIGIIGSIPLGLRAQHASLRIANLNAVRAFYTLRNVEDRVQTNLEVAYRLVVSSYEVIIARRAQREAFAEQVDARFKEYIAGKTTVDFLLTAQQQWAAALSQEYQAITNYNTSLAAFEYCKGTLLRHDNIQINEGPLPTCVHVRAVENERQRAQAIACLQRNAVVPTSQETCMPVLSEVTAPSVPSLMMDRNLSEMVPDKNHEASSLRRQAVGSGQSANASPMPVGPREPAAMPTGPTFNPALESPAAPTLPGPLPLPSSGSVVPPPPPLGVQ